MPAITKPITYEDSLAMPENKLEEIVDGESRIMPPPTVRHWKLLRRLAQILREQLSAKDYAVENGPVGLGIRRRPVLTYRIPDLTVFDAGILATIGKDKDRDDPYIWIQPELLVECLSPSNRKGALENLIRDYESIGVPEVWLIYPGKHELRIYLLQQGSPLEQRTVEAGEVSPERLPGVRVDVNELWEAFDF